MAKIPFSKLGLKLNSDIKTVNIGDYNIEVCSYLPMEEKATLISNVINNSIDDNGYYNPLKIKVFLTLEVLYFYTNLTFTTKMKEDPQKLYDCVISNGLFEKIVQAIPEDEWADLQNTTQQTVSNIYNFKNSAMGILSYIASDYSAIEMDASKIQQMLADPESLTLLKEVVSKLG